MYDGVPTPAPTLGNRLLDALPPSERDLVRANATLTALKRHDRLFHPNDLVDAVHFPVDGIVSLVCLLKGGGQVETATIGREGMVGTAVFHGVPRASQLAVAQVEGHSYRIDTGTFLRIIPELPTLSALLHRFSESLYMLAAQNSGCNRKHSVEERCCRWMLSVADRLDRPTFEFTHDLIANMLGCRRASVTEALGGLEKRGLVKTSRGRITIVDRVGLEASVCECYQIIRDAMALASTPSA